MGNLRACFAVAMLALAACGSDNAKTDASIVLIDSPSPDAKVWNDAPPGPTYDFSCFGMTPPTPTVADEITISGTTQTFSTGGASPLASVVVDVFENGNATALGSDTSDAAGAFATGNIPTGGTAIEGYVRAVAPVPPPQNPNDPPMPTHRSTYLYPPGKVAASLTGVPVIMISNATFAQIENFLGMQNDTVNGALLFLVTDCSTTSQTLVAGATVDVKHNGTSINTLNLGLASSQLDGTFVAANVPDGEVQINVSYKGMNFPTRTVRAYKRPAPDAAGTLTFTAVRPGP